MYSLKYIRGFSKSYTHRFIILAWINEQDIIIKNFTKSDDIMATLNALYDHYHIIRGNLYLKASDRVCRDEIFVGESGSTLRFLIPLMLDGREVKFITEGRLAKRPLDEYKRIILDENGEFNIGGNKITIKGNLEKNKYNISSEHSSQFVSGMMMASRGNFEVIYDATNSAQYIEITKDSMDIFKHKPSVVYVPNDMSNYAFFYAMYKKGLIDSIEKPVPRCQNDFIFIDNVDNIRGKYNLKNSIDTAPILCAYLSTICGVFEINGLENLKYKESNRLAEILRVLKFFGVTVSTNGYDKIRIKGSTEKRGIKGGISVSDHRIAHMILFLKYYHGADIKIKGLESLKKSDHNIWRYFKRREDV